jgi:hypothetical protein
MATVDTINAIINNALSTANSAVNSADAAAQGAITASQGYAFGGGRDVEYDMSALEPAIGAVEDATLTYESQRDRLIALLSDKLADFFTTYYPLAADAFDEATNWLVNTITVGGTGISPAVEDQIWQRGRDRIIADGARVESQTLNEFAARGLTLPSGAMASRLQEVRFEQLTKTQELSRDVAIKQADLEVENLKFAVDLAVKSRMQAVGVAVDYIRALMSGADTASRVALLNADAKARLVSATADLYRARLSRDEIAMRIPLANASNLVQQNGIGTDGFYKGVGARVQAAAAAAESYGRVASAALASLNSVAAVSNASFS